MGSIGFCASLVYREHGLQNGTRNYENEPRLESLLSNHSVLLLFSRIRLGDGRTQGILHVRRPHVFQAYLNAGSCSRWLRRAAGENPSGCLSSLYPRATSHSCLSWSDCKASLHVSMVWHHSLGLRNSHLVREVERQGLKRFRLFIWRRSLWRLLSLKGCKGRNVCGPAFAAQG